MFLPKSGNPEPANQISLVTDFTVHLCVLNALYMYRVSTYKEKSKECGVVAMVGGW